MRSAAGGVPGGTLQLAAATVQVLSCRQRLSTLSPSVTMRSASTADKLAVEARACAQVVDDDVRLERGPTGEHHASAVWQTT